MLDSECHFCMCLDGLNHVFQVCDDGGRSRAPVCGAAIKITPELDGQYAGDDSEVCEPCARWMLKWAGCGDATYERLEADRDAEDARREAKVRKA